MGAGSAQRACLRGQILVHRHQRYSLSHFLGWSVRMLPWFRIEPRHRRGGRHITEEYARRWEVGIIGEEMGVVFFISVYWKEKFLPSSVSHIFWRISVAYATESERKSALLETFTLDRTILYFVLRQVSRAFEISGFGWWVVSMYRSMEAQKSCTHPQNYNFLLLVSSLPFQRNETSLHVTHSRHFCVLVSGWRAYQYHKYRVRRWVFLLQR